MVIVFTIGRYCGARESSGWNSSPWGSNLLCVVHYVQWKKKKTLKLPAEASTGRRGCGLP